MSVCEHDSSCPQKPSGRPRSPCHPHYRTTVVSFQFKLGQFKTLHKEKAKSFSPNWSCLHSRFTCRGPLDLYPGSASGITYMLPPWGISGVTWLSHPFPSQQSHVSGSPNIARGGTGRQLVMDNPLSRTLVTLSLKKPE